MKAPLIVCIVLMAGLMAFTTYRACVSSLTVDEAWTRLYYVDHPLAGFNSNHHILNTYAMKASALLLGDSEFSLRLPALLGGLLFMVGALFLARDICGPGWKAALLFAALALNPFQLDYMALARGYGLGCAFLLWAILFWRWKKPVAASLAMGLAVASHLGMAFPCGALGLVAVIFRIKKQYPVRQLPALVLPGALVFLIIAGPLLPAMMRRHDSTIHEGNWVTEGNTGGVGTINQSIASIASAGLANVEYPGSAWLSDAAGQVVLPVVLLLACAYVIKRLMESEPLDGAFAVTAHVAIVCGLITAVHVTAGLNYPGARFGIYFYLLLIIMAGQLLRARRVLYPATFAALIVIFAAQLHVHGYYYDQVAEGVRESARMIPGDRPAVIYLAPSANMRRLPWTWYAGLRRQAIEITSDPLPRAPDCSRANIFVDTNTPLPPPHWTKVYGNDCSHFMLFAYQL